MIRFVKVLLSCILTAIFILTAGTTYSQTDEEIVSYFVKEQLEIKPGQTVFNVYKIENRTNRAYQIQINFTVPAEWTLFADHTVYLNIEPRSTKSIPLRVSPSLDAKGGVGYALNAAMLTNEGNMFSSRYCFLTIPIRNQIDADFSALAYYLDHLHGQTELALKIHNSGNTNSLVNIQLDAAENLNFTDAGYNKYITQISLEPEKDTTLRLKLKYNDYIGDLDYYSRTLTAELFSKDTTWTRYAFIKYLNYRYDNFITDEDRPLVIEASAMDLLSDYITFRFLVMGKLKFKNQRSLQYYYRSMSAPLKDHPNLERDEYFADYKMPKTEIKVGNFRLLNDLCLFGKTISVKRDITPTLDVQAYVSDDYYTNNYAFSGTVNKKFGVNSVFATYTKMINDTTGKSFLDFYGAGGVLKVPAGRFQLSGYYSRYSAPEFNNKDGYQLNVGYSNSFNSKLITNSNARFTTPYFATYYHGRSDIASHWDYLLSKKAYLSFVYSYYKYQPATVYNQLNPAFNYQYHNFRFIYNLRFAMYSTIYFGPNYDYGMSNYYGAEFAKDNLVLTSTKAEVGYRYNPNNFVLNSLNINMQVGQTNPVQYDKTLMSQYNEKKPVIKFSATLSGRNWGVLAMYYSGLYNMSTALINFYSSIVGKYLYFMPFYRITSPGKQFYYEVRFSYLNNIDLSNVRTSIVQEAGVEFGKGWSFKLLNNTNIQSITDTRGQNYRYTNNYMEFTVRKVFHWSQPGQKYHSLNAYFYRDLNGNHIKDYNEPGVENVLVNIQNNSTIDSSYHYEGEMFGNVDVASNHLGLIQYNEIPEAKYCLRFDPKDGNQGMYNIINNQQIVNLRKDTTIYIPFTERNKVYGHVIFHKKKQSMFDDWKNENIKVSISDNHGNAWFALTDKNGYYEIFAPASDYYTVKIDNLWPDLWNLRQNQYIIKFNGYKTFEVNFEFEEKKREIVFDDIVDIGDILSEDNFQFEDVTQIKQTVVTGNVADETNLLPLQATIEIVDLNRNSKVSKTKCTPEGEFYTSFITGKNYQLRISYPGYWIYQEALNSNQITTFEKISRDGILLRKIQVGKPIEMRNLTFELESSELSPEAKAELENLVIRLVNNEKIKINIVGYCNSRENSIELARKRAAVVETFLKTRSIATSRITTEGKIGDKSQAPKVEIIVTSNQ